MISNIDLFLKFLKSIDIDYKESNKIPVDSFSPHIELNRGVIFINPEKVHLMDLIHDAGHMALIPKKFRSLFSDNMMQGFKQYNNYLDTLDYESIENKILEATNDPCVTAWSWAVGKHLGFKSEDVIANCGYGGMGADIRRTLELSNRSTMPYFGVSQMHHAGYTKKYNPREKTSECYPKLNYWTADQALEANNIRLNLDIS